MTSDLTSDKVTVSAHIEENVANTSEVAACWGEVYGGAGGGPVQILLLSRGAGGRQGRCSLELGAHSSAGQLPVSSSVKWGQVGGAQHHV